MPAGIYAVSFKIGQEKQFSIIKEALLYTVNGDTIYVFGIINDPNIYVAKDIKIIGKQNKETIIQAAKFSVVN